MTTMENEVTKWCSVLVWLARLGHSLLGDENTVVNAQLTGFIPRCFWLPAKGPLAVGPSSKTQTHARCTADSALAKESVRIPSALLPTRSHAHRLLFRASVGKLTFRGLWGKGHCRLHSSPRVLPLSGITDVCRMF